MSNEDDMIKMVLDVGKDVAEDIVRPTSKSVGENIGLLVDGVMGWLGFWGKKQQIKREVYLDDYKQKITKKIETVPGESLIEPPIRIVGPAIEASKFFIEEEYCREMFSQLIASSCNSNISRSVHPAFPEMIKQLSINDASFLRHFLTIYTIPCVEVFEHHNNGKITPFPHILFDFKGSSPTHTESDELALTETINNLTRLGLIVLNQKVIELDYDYKMFENHWFYKLILKAIEEESHVEMRKYRIELTELGKDFKKCCL